MKRQRESSPSGSKRPRERREDPPLALLMAESRGYHRRSRSREKTRTLPRLREERAAVLDLQQHRGGDLSLLGRPPLRTTAAEPPPPRPGTLEYKTLLISNLGAQVSDEDVEDALFHEFKKFGDVSVKLSVSAELGRVAYVNFRHPEDAKEARHSKNSRLVLGERQLKIEPMYVRRRSVTPPDSGFPAALAPPYPQYRQRSLSPPSSSSMRDLRARHFALETLSRERDRLLDYYGMLDDRGRPYGFPPTPVVVEDLKPEDDQRATSNLFIGNLDGNVTEAELRRGFDKYGVIEDVVIKRPARGQGGAYAFVKFQNLDMAHRAKVAMQGRLMGGNPIKIGYGKANPTTRLWVGGLPSGNSLAALAREFDRFGSIRNIDYVKGDSFAYIQYESLDASQAACTQMRGFPLGGAERRLRVDFAKVMEESPPPPRVFPSGYQPPNVAPLSQHFEVLGETFSRHRSLEREMRGRERPSPPNHRERPSSPPNHRERPSSPPNHRERPSSPPNHRERPSSPPNNRERPSSPPNHRERPSSPPREKDFSLERSLERGEMRVGAGGRERPSSPPPQREKDFSLERREAFGRRGGMRSRSRSRERWLKEREERRGERGVARRRNSTSPPEREGRARGRGGAVSPDARVRAPDSTTEPENGGRHSNLNTNTNEEDPPPSSRHSKRPVDPPAGDAPPSHPNSAPPSSLSEFAAATLTKTWHGFFALKNSSFPAELFLLEGGAAFFHASLKRAAAPPGQLKIAQRLRMDRTRLDEVRRRLKTGRPDGFSVLLALQGPVEVNEDSGLQARLLRHLVTYLRNKEAAGVVSLPASGGGPGAMLYAFPPGLFSQQYLQEAKRTVGNLDEEHMVVVIVSDTN